MTGWFSVGSLSIFKGFGGLPKAFGRFHTFVEFLSSPKSPWELSTRACHWLIANNDDGLPRVVFFLNDDWQWWMVHCDFNDLKRHALACNGLCFCGTCPYIHFLVCPKWRTSWVRHVKASLSIELLELTLWVGWWMACNTQGINEFKGYRTIPQMLHFKISSFQIWRIIFKFWGFPNMYFLGVMNTRLTHKLRSLKICKFEFRKIACRMNCVLLLFQAFKLSDFQIFKLS